MIDRKFGTVRMRLMKLVTIVLSVLLMFTVWYTFCGSVQASELTVSYGEDIWVESWCSKDVETRAFELELKTSYNRWLDIGVVAHTVWSETSQGHFWGTDLSLILAGRLIAHKMLSERIFVEGFGGLGWILLGEPPEIGRRPYVGNFGAAIGYKFDRWSIMYRADHWSVPFYRGDKGHNRHYIGIRIPFT